MIQPEASHDTDRAAAIDWLFERVIMHVGAFRLWNGTPYEVGSDDVAMRTAAQDDCFTWLDDCEARLGCDVADARAAMVDFIYARDGATGDAELADVLADAHGEAIHEFGAQHPVSRGLNALIQPSAQ